MAVKVGKVFRLRIALHTIPFVNFVGHLIILFRCVRKKLISNRNSRLSVLLMGTIRANVISVLISLM